MCISTSHRHAAALAQRPAVDAAQLLSQVVKPTISSDAEPSSCSAKKRNRHITVTHDYHDHATDSPANYQEEHPARGGVTTPFPLKLHEMLDAVAADGLEDVVSWQPHGRCFVVHKPKEFVEMLPHYFKLSKLASFQRQLNLYGFQRLTRGRDRGGYYNELFLRDRVFLAHSIQRIKVKGTGVRARSNPEDEPNFWSMPWVTSANKDVMVNQAPQTPSFAAPSTSFDFSMFSKPSDDIIMAFGSKTFHYLDPFQQQEPVLVEEKPAVAANEWTEVEELLAGEAESFFEDFDFPDEMGPEIEDDLVFGNLLEQMIA
jgi:hypothetical protein